MEKANTNQSVMIDSAVNDTTKAIIGCAYSVSNSLGCGFLERVYENAMVHELGKYSLKL